MLLSLFIYVQFSLMLFMALHDWIDLPPLTNIKELREHHSSRFIILSMFINTLPVAWSLYLTSAYYPGPYPFWIKINFVIIYSIITFGTLCAWWIPYIFGSSQKHKEGFAEYKDTHTFLPARGDNVVPNTLHIMLHLQVWFCCAVSWYLLFKV